MRLHQRFQIFIGCQVLHIQLKLNFALLSNCTRT